MPAAKDEVSASLEGGITLRPYQREGANWLLWSRKQGRSVILGDEMGLGKTMQVVACLRHQVVEWGCDGPFLVVAPLSTIGHWERELGRAPELRPQVLRGPAAERRAQLREGGPSGVRAWTVLITTYETLLSDARALQGIEWSGLVFDEAQRLKNAKSKSFAAAAALRCEHKVLLSGTPLQNSVGELWSLLHLLSPTGFADEVAFGRRFGGLETARQATALSSLLRPFLLRRTKADVEVSLEPLTEMLIYVEVTALQKMTYRAICERNRELLVPSERGGKRSSLSFRNLEVLMRHCCNHPYLVAGVEEEEEVRAGGYGSPAAELDALVAASGKTVLLSKLLPHLTAGGHRTLLFSQFKLVLDLLEDVLDHLGLPYERLDGDVTGAARQAAIARFEAPGCTTPVFLLGTRAGGLGITLTSADTVVLYDPDWNPQADLQAAARCHRIGQAKPVTVYRLVTRDTYEMALYARANQKRGLEQAVIGHGDFGAAAGGRRGAAPDAAEIEALLRRGAHVLTLGEEQDEASRRFASSSIEHLLAANAVAIDSSAGRARSGGVFAEATFVSGEESGVPDLDDPDFWTRVLPPPPPVEAAPSADSRSLRRRASVVVEESDGSPSSEEEEESGLPPPRGGWSPSQLRALVAGVLRLGPGRFGASQHLLSVPELETRPREEVQIAIRAVVRLWLEAQPSRGQKDAPVTLCDVGLTAAADPDPAAEAAEPCLPAPPFPVPPSPAPCFSAPFVRRQTSEKQCARALRQLCSLAALGRHREQGRPVSALRLRRRKVFEGWSTEHDAALLDAIWTAGFPSPRRPASDLACWRSAARHIAAAAPALASLSPLATDGEAGSEAAEVPADGGDGGVAAATRALSDRATQLCRAMLAYEREQSRDLAKEAEARERRRAEAEEKRRQREAAEEAKRLAREQKALERAAAADAKAAAAEERRRVKEERRAEREKEEAKSVEQRREEKKAREEERVNSLLEQGKKVWAASREVEDLPDKRPYPPVPPSAAGKPQERNRSCHICTQGIASWRGAFTAPLGCSKCPRIFCERCLGHLQDEALLPLAGKPLSTFFDDHWDDWTCLMCRGVCACQESQLSAKVPIASVCAAGPGRCRIKTAEPHPFRSGDSVSVSGCKLAASAGPVASKALQPVNKQHGSVTWISPGEIELRADASGLPPVAEASGHVTLPTIEKHKRRGWVGVTGSGAIKASPATAAAVTGKRKGSPTPTKRKFARKGSPSRGGGRRTPKKTSTGTRKAKA